MKQKNNVAYWEDTFREEVESTRIEDGILIWAFSGPCFALRTPETMIYLDAYFGGDPVECTPNTYRTTQIPMDPGKITLADAVLISHDHYDHCHEQTLEPMARGTDARFYGPVSAMKEMDSYDLPKNRLCEVKAGDSLRIKDAAIRVWPAYDEGEPSAVTYTIESGGVKVFFGGDSSSGPAFDEVGSAGDLDIAMIAFGRTWYMNEAQLLDAAQRLRPRVLIPFHWELWRSHTGDVIELGKLIERRKPSFDVNLMLVGDYLHYSQGGNCRRGR